MMLTGLMSSARQALVRLRTVPRLYPGRAGSPARSPATLSCWPRCRRRPAAGSTGDWLAPASTRLRYEEGVRDAVDTSAGRSRFLTPLETVETIAGYAETIGDVEQNMPGEEQALDPLLRHAVVAAPGDAAIGLPGDLTTIDYENGGDEARPRPSQPPDAMLTPELKRARLEQLLRKRIAESGSTQTREDVNHTDRSS
jgi:hypothetical protein